MRHTALFLVAALAAGEGVAQTWTPIGPQPLYDQAGYPRSGRVTSIAFDRSDARIVFIGTAGGGVWKSIDDGVHWLPMSDDQPSLAIGTVVSDPNNQTVLFVGTGAVGLNDVDLQGAGVLVTRDRGATWAHLPGPFATPAGTHTWANRFFNNATAHIQSIAINPEFGKTMIAAVDYDYLYPERAGIYRSTDYGSSWTQVQQGIFAADVVWDPGDSRVAFAAIGGAGVPGTGGIYKTVTYGETWFQVNGPRPDGLSSDSLDLSSPSIVRLAMAQSAPSTLYATVSSVSGTGARLPNPGTYKTTDGGNHWTRLATSPFRGELATIAPFFIAVDPHNPDLVFEGYGSLYRSRDGGTTWETIGVDARGVLVDGTHGDMRALAFSPTGEVFLGDDGGVFKTSAPSARPIVWVNLNDTLSIAQFYPGVSIHPFISQAAFAGSQDNGTLAGVPAGPSAHFWKGVACGDGGRTIVDPSSPAFVYTICQDGNTGIPGGAVLRSDAYGSPGTFRRAVTGIDMSEFGAWITPLAMDPRNPQRLYYGRQRVYQTTNRAGTWAPISPRLSDLRPPIFGRLTTIAVAPTNSSIVYAGTDAGQVIATSNALSAEPRWTSVSAGLPARYITEVVIDSSGTLYATLNGISGFGGDLAGHVFKMTTAGSGWSDISGDLPNIAVNGLVVDPDSAFALYAATDTGVYWTNDGGVHWALLGSGLPHAVVTGLAFEERTRTLRAGTFGRGAWDLVVPEPTLSTTRP